jgi:hypothetical protein
MFSYVDAYWNMTAGLDNTAILNSLPPRLRGSVLLAIHGSLLKGARCDSNAYPERYSRAGVLARTSAICISRQLTSAWLCGVVSRVPDVERVFRGVCEDHATKGQAPGHAAKGRFVGSRSVVYRCVHPYHRFAANHVAISRGCRKRRGSAACPSRLDDGVLVAGEPFQGLIVCGSC